MSNIERAAPETQPDTEPVVAVPLTDEPVVAAPAPATVPDTTVPASQPVDVQPMSEPVIQETPSSKSYFPYTSSLFHNIVRGLQSMFTSLVLSLTATSIAKASWGDSKTNFGLAVSVMTFVYFLAGGIFWGFASASARSAVPVSVFFGLEAFFVLMWFCAFVVLADNFSHSCNYGSFFWTSSSSDDWSVSCKAGKAAAAFAAFAWLFFVVSFIIYIFNVLRPVLSHYGSSDWLKMNAVELNPWTFLSGTFIFNNFVAQEDFKHEEGLPETATNSTYEPQNQVPPTTV